MPTVRQAAVSFSSLSKMKILNSRLKLRSQNPGKQMVSQVEEQL